MKNYLVVGILIGLAVVIGLGIDIIRRYWEV